MIVYGPKPFLNDGPVEELIVSSKFCRCVLACPSSRHSSVTTGALSSDRWVRRGSLSYPSTEVGECAVTCRRRRPLWTPVAASSARRGRRLRRGRPSSRRTSGRALGAIRERRSASDGRDCAAPVLARDPLEMVAVEPQTLTLRGIERRFHGRGDPIVDS